MVPQCTTATGVVAGRPPPSRPAAISARLAMPINTTSVPRAPSGARAAQSMPVSDGPSPTRPVTTVTDVETPRWVTGMPAEAGTANADDTPGTTS